MKLYIFLSILFLPILVVCQTDSLSFDITVEKDSSMNFSDANLEFFNYFEETIDNKIERGFFPRETSIVRVIISDSKLDSIIIYGSYENLNQAIKLALEDLDTITISSLKNQNRLELILTFRRWKETGEFSMSGRIISGT